MQHLNNAETLSTSPQNLEKVATGIWRFTHSMQPIVVSTTVLTEIVNNWHQMSSKHCQKCHPLFFINGRLSTPPQVCVFISTFPLQLLQEVKTYYNKMHKTKILTYYSSQAFVFVLNPHLFIILFYLLRAPTPPLTISSLLCIFTKIAIARKTRVLSKHIENQKPNRTQQQLSNVENIRKKMRNRCLQ